MVFIYEFYFKYVWSELHILHDRTLSLSMIMVGVAMTVAGVGSHLWEWSVDNDFLNPFLVVVNDI